MKHWASFTIRLIARLGLMVSLVVWISGQLHAWSSETKLGTRSVVMTTDSEAIRMAWMPRYVTSVFGNQLAGIHRDSAALNAELNSAMGHLQVDHWLLCLTFLIATIATSVRWREPGAEPEPERTGE